MMSIVARLFAICSLAVLASCGAASNSAPGTGAAAAWKIADSQIRFGPDISPTATGTDYNSNFVWDGYSGGNRKRQVVGLFRTAIADVAGAQSGSQPVKLNVVVTKFHAITGPAQTWCCGKHNIVADLEVVDPESGTVLAAQPGVYLGTVALGGIPGIIANAAGNDQITRVRKAIAKGIAGWMGGL